ncbi:hypothetical protein E7Y32_06845 [Arthrobacter sp. UKPF54-2]|uniref:hypothetical protein n=1 Tax=Arthrobacter sp. UKPF54-2 TaxID=2600159 RepID=UPI0011B110CE|nr:hypothetical protein [Arthrobacter sp. UKPF54-2]QDY89960.1 hypothetical protein E7Y32_06845 [Arthrobacter sp. UKPF54-2]
MAIERAHVGYATAAVAVAAIPLSFVGPEALRLAVVGLFLLAGPGTALVLLIRFGPDSSSSTVAAGAIPLATALAVAVSLTLSTLVATAMIYARLWAPPAGVCLLALVTLGLLAVDYRRTRPAPAEAR